MNESPKFRFWSKQTPWPLRLGMVIVIIWFVGTVAMLAAYFLGVETP